jgi:hypothetical protein
MSEVHTPRDWLGPPGETVTMRNAMRLSDGKIVGPSELRIFSTPHSVIRRSLETTRAP